MAEPNLLKLQNTRSGKKETLPQSNPLSIYLPLPPAFRDLEANPPLNHFQSLGIMRLFYFGGLVGRAAQIERRNLRLTNTPDEAVLIIYGDPLLNPGEILPLEKARFALQLEGVIFKGEGNQEAFEVLRRYSPEEVQYLFLGTHYRQALIVSEAALNNAHAALARLHDYAERFGEEAAEKAAVISKKADVDLWRERFYQQIQDDLNAPRALAIIWTMLQAQLGPGDKLSLLAEFNRVLGLNLAISLPVVAAKVSFSNGHTMPVPAGSSQNDKDKDKGKKLPESKKPEAGKGKDRERVKEGDRELGKAGGKTGKPRPGKFMTGTEGQVAPPKDKAAPKPGQPEEKIVEPRRKIESTRQVRSFLGEADRFDFTVSLLAHNNLAELRATVESLLFYTTRGARRVEVIVVDLGSTDGSNEYLDGVAAGYANFRVMLASPQLGEAAGRNLTFRQGRGKFLLLLDVGLSLSGDLFEELAHLIEPDKQPALYGLYPLKLKRESDNSIVGFEAQPLPKERSEVEALEGSLLCLRRSVVEEAGFMDEHFRLPYALDLDYSFAFKDKNFEVVVLPELATLVNRPAGFSRPDYNLPPAEIERQRQKNWNLFIKSWSL